MACALQNSVFTVQCIGHTELHCIQCTGALHMHCRTHYWRLHGTEVTYLQCNCCTMYSPVSYTQKMPSRMDVAPWCYAGLEGLDGIGIGSPGE